MIYLDNSATTKPCKEAVEAMTDALSEHWGNPSALYGIYHALIAYSLLCEARLDSIELTINIAVQLQCL